FGQQSLEPACIPGSLHAYPHADSSLLQIAIEPLGFSIAVVQSSFVILAGLFNQKCNLLKARVIIYAYNQHVRLLPPEPVVVKQPKFTRVEEPTLLCNQYEFPPIPFSYLEGQGATQNSFVSNEVIVSIHIDSLCSALFSICCRMIWGNLGATSDSIP